MMNAKSCKPFDPVVFLSSVGLCRKIVEVEPEQSFFAQGDPADSIYCLQQGRAKLGVVSDKGKQATITLLNPGDFFGEESLGTAPALRVATATAVNNCAALRIKREEMIRIMHQEHEFSDQFLSYLLARSQRTQADLVDQIFNSSEKRLARTLLLLARYGKQEQPDRVLPKVSQETLASMVGTTRSRVNFFMNKFRKLGFIEYNGKIKVNKSLLTVVLHE
jgi:CRP/FNR family cyclic AMP-dependent transcriptional regulator